MMNTVLSMTGRGTGSAMDSRVRVEVEISSVNRKQLDVGILLPRWLQSFESRVQNVLKKKISRGRLSGEIRLTWTAEAQIAGIHVNEELANAYVQALRKTAVACKLPDDLQASALIGLPEVVRFDRDSTDTESLWPVMEDALRAAMDELVGMRAQEGATLAADLMERFALLSDYVTQLETQAPQVAEEYRRNLFKRLESAELGGDLLADERVLKEIALFADRADVTEELVRLKSHLTQGKECLTTGGVVGRTLDFLVQEMGREVNTVGSKANNGDMTRLVILCKTELERIREQVQNLE